jgi:hypothetical protein
MMMMKMKPMMVSVPPIQFSKNFFFFSHKNASSASHKVNSSLRKKKKTTTFSNTRISPLFAFLLFFERERERERE